MFIHNRLTQHVSGIIMPIFRRTDYIKPRVMLAWMCWLWLCGVGTRAERTVSALSLCPGSTVQSPWNLVVFRFKFSF